MQRLARSHFIVFKVNRWMVALAIAIALAVLLLPVSSPVEVTRHLVVEPAQVVVRQGVTLLGRDFSGKSEDEARHMLTEMAAAIAADAVPASETRQVGGISKVIPELNGMALDVDATLYRLTTARAGSAVEPATRIKAPSPKVTDFPRSAIERGNAHKQAVGLLINVDWGDDDLWKMLGTLKRRGVKATFFVSGRWAEKNKNILKYIAVDGHEIASHGYDLSMGPKALAQQGRLAEDIRRSVGVIEQIAGRKVRYWAPHMSEVSAEILKTASDLGLRTVLYSLDTIDWRESTTPQMILGVMQKAKSGDLILLHPKPNTAQVLDQAVADLLAKGLTPMTLTEVISPDPGTTNKALDHQHERQ